MSSRMQHAIAVQNQQSTGNSMQNTASKFGPSGQSSRLQGRDSVPNNDNSYRKIISGKDLGGQGLMMPNIRPGD